MENHPSEIPMRFTHIRLTPATHTYCVPPPPAPCSRLLVEITQIGSPALRAREDVGAMIDDRARPVRDPVWRRDECVAVEKKEGWAGSKKIPAPGAGRGCLKGPCLTLLVSRRSLRDGYRGRSPDLRIILLTNAFPAVSWPVACPVGFRPRIQWRVREGVAPSSRKPHLYSENSDSS